MSLFHFLSFFIVRLYYVHCILIQLVDEIFQLLTIVCQFSDFLVRLGSLFFCHQSMAHTVRYRAIIEALISVKLSAKFISDTHEQEASFGAINGNLSYELIKALLE